MHDASGDRVPDSTTIVELFNSGATPLYVTSFAWSPNGDLYLLDSRCQDIYRATDTTGDGWVNALGETPFAKSDDYPQLLDVAVLVSEVDYTVDAITDSDTGSRRTIPYVRFLDSDEDGAANSVAKIRPKGLGIRDG